MERLLFIVLSWIVSAFLVLNYFRSRTNLQKSLGIVCDSLGDPERKAENINLAICQKYVSLWGAAICFVSGIFWLLVVP